MAEIPGSNPGEPIVKDEGEIEAEFGFEDELTDDEAGEKCAEILLKLEDEMDGLVFGPDHTPSGDIVTKDSGRVHTGSVKDEYHWLEFRGDYVFEDAEKQVEVYLESVPSKEGELDIMGVYAKLRVINVKGEELLDNLECYAEAIGRSLDGKEENFEYEIDGP